MRGVQALDTPQNTLSFLFCNRITARRYKSPLTWLAVFGLLLRYGRGIGPFNPIGRPQAWTVTTRRTDTARMLSGSRTDRDPTAAVRIPRVDQAGSDWASPSASRKISGLRRNDPLSIVRRNPGPRLHSAVAMRRRRVPEGGERADADSDADPRLAPLPERVHQSVRPDRPDGIDTGALHAVRASTARHRRPPFVGSPGATRVRSQRLTSVRCRYASSCVLAVRIVPCHMLDKLAQSGTSPSCPDRHYADGANGHLCPRPHQSFLIDCMY